MVPINFKPKQARVKWYSVNKGKLIKVVGRQAGKLRQDVDNGAVNG